MEAGTTQEMVGALVKIDRFGYLNRPTNNREIHICRNRSLKSKSTLFIPQRTANRFLMTEFEQSFTRTWVGF
jgi:hypothetical protein